VFFHAADEIHQAGNLRDSLIKALETGMNLPPLR
jgi:hypothetical protein